MAARTGARGLGIAAAVIVLAFLIAWLFRGEGRSVARIGANTSSIDRNAASRSAIAEPERAPPTELDSTRADEPPRMFVRPEQRAQESIEDRSREFVVFRFDGGEPASGLLVRRADVPPSGYRQEVRKEAPRWDLHLDSQGRIGLEPALKLGGVVAVRLSEAATELVPFDPSSTREYTLAPVVDQEFRLEGGPYDASATFEVTLGTLDALRYAGVDFQNNPIEEPFADLYSPVAASLSDASLVACARLRLGAAGGATRRKLPVGRYCFGPVDAPIGWWMDWKDVYVSGAPISIAVKTVPVARVTLKRDEKGEVIAPLHVEIFMHSKGPGYEDSGEIRLPSESRGDQVSVSLWWHPLDESYDHYALKLLLAGWHVNDDERGIVGGSTHAHRPQREVKGPSTRDRPRLSLAWRGKGDG